MLKPSMQQLMKRVGNRYQLVNLAAQRARDLAAEAERNEQPLTEKAVKLALDEIAEGRIVYKPGPKPEPIVVPQAPTLHTTLSGERADEDEIEDFDEDEDALDLDAEEEE